MSQMAYGWFIMISSIIIGILIGVFFEDWRVGVAVALYCHLMAPMYPK